MSIPDWVQEIVWVILLICFGWAALVGCFYFTHRLADCWIRGTHE